MHMAVTLGQSWGLPPPPPPPPKPIYLLSVYLLSSHVTRSSKPPPSIFAYCKQSKTLRMRLGYPFFGHDLDVSSFPPDPTQWTEDQVYRWVVWAVQEFNLTRVNLSALRGISGHQLCSFTYQQFEQLGFHTQEAACLKWYLNYIKAGKPINLPKFEMKSFIDIRPFTI